MDITSLFKKNTNNTSGQGTATNFASFLKKTKFRNGANSLFLTAFTAALLALFLMPFLYMVLTSLKTKEQLTVLGTPIYPAAIPTFTFNGENTGTYTFKIHKGGILADQKIDLNKYVGKELEIFIVPLEGGNKNLALVQGYQQDAIFLDPRKSFCRSNPVEWWILQGIKTPVDIFTYLVELCRCLETN